MKRRTFLLSGGALITAAAAPFVWRAATARDYEEGELLDVQKDWRESVPEGIEFELDLAKITKDKAAWRSELEPASYDVLFRDATERAWTSPLNDEKRPGVFVCRACELPLFTTAMKFDSGTGWPSFFTHIPGHMGTKKDFKLIWPRTEYHCIRCGGHQGHVFNDGPAPTGQRWCNNGVALRFLPKTLDKTA